MTLTRPVIDAARLPPDAPDSRAPAWWGNVLFMVIETTTVALLLASYFYLWRNLPGSQWPPVQANTNPPVLKPVPELLYGSLNTILMLATLPLAWWLYRACARRYAELDELNAAQPSDVPADRRPEEKPAAVLAGLLAMAFLVGVATALRFREFPALRVAWNENAYASLVWSLLGLHLLYLVIETLEFLILFVWAALYGLDQNESTDVMLTVEYWYWTVGVWVVLYAVVYWFPRVVT